MLLYRYILRHFFQTLVFGLFALSVIFIIVNLLENLGDFLDRNMPLMLIVEYYLNYLPEIIKLMTPVATLLSCLFTTGRLGSTNEITAMKSGGMSIYRFMLPLVFATVSLSAFQLWFNGWQVPRSIERRTEIEAQYKGGGANYSVYSLYFRDTPTRNVLINYLDPTRGEGSGLEIDEFSSAAEPRLVRRIEADRFVWDSSAQTWTVFAARELTFHGFGKAPSERDISGGKAPFTVSPTEIQQLQKTVEKMTLPEFKEWIELSRKGGNSVSKQEVAYYAEWALPFANIIVIFFGLPFSAGKRKGGMAIEIGATMALAFFYLTFNKIGQTVGHAANLPPWLSAWMANISFFVIGLLNIARIRT